MTSATTNAVARLGGIERLIARLLHDHSEDAISHVDDADKPDATFMADARVILGDAHAKIVAAISAASAT